MLRGILVALLLVSTAWAEIRYYGLGVRPAAYRPKLTDGLVAYYKLDLASGADSHGGNTLTASASPPTSDTGKIATAAAMAAASGQYFYASDSPSLSTGQGVSFTVCAWVYLTDPNQADPSQIFGKWDTGINQREFYMQYAPNQGGAGVGRFKFSVSTDGAIGTVDSAVTNTFGEAAATTWYYVCGGYESGVQAWIRVNCGTVDVAAHTGGVFDSSTLLSMGAYNAGTVPVDFMDGRIDSLGFWKRTLTTAECQQLYALGVGLEYPW